MRLFDIHVRPKKMSIASFQNHLVLQSLRLALASWCRTPAGHSSTSGAGPRRKTPKKPHTEFEINDLQWETQRKTLVKRHPHPELKVQALFFGTRGANLDDFWQFFQEA